MSQIVGALAARDALVGLVSAIRTALRTADGQGNAAYNEAVDSAMQDLEKFWKATVPASYTDADDVAAIRKIDAIAYDLFLEIGFQSLDANNAALEDGAERLEQLAEEIGELAASTAADADTVALRPVKDAVDSLTETITAIRDARARLDGTKPDHAAIISEIDKLATQFLVLKGKVEAAV